MKQQFIKSSFVAAFLTVLAGSAAAANLNVSATVNANCSITTAPVAFGTAYDTVTGTAVTSTGTVTIACTKGAASTITLGAGGFHDGTTRRMTDGAGTPTFLSYELYQQPNNTPGTACNYTAPTVWTAAAGGIFTPANAPSKVARTYNVCGRIVANQDVPAATYTDIVVATVVF
jgi:spore coat protein U-like protein